MRGIIFGLGTVLFIVLFFTTFEKICAEESLSVPPEEASEPTKSAQIYLSEIMPSNYTDEEGIDRKEFVEIYNGEDTEVDLNGWKLVDVKGAVVSYLFTQKIEPKGYLVLSHYNDSKFVTLNDDGDGINLFNPGGELVNHAEYSSSLPNQSLSFINNLWQWTSIISPGAPNQLSTDNPKENSEQKQTKNIDPIKINEARENQDGESVSIIATVTASPATISDSFFYVQDATGGLQVYCYYKDFPLLKMGDKLLINGVLSTIAGERRIKITGRRDIALLESAPPPEPEKIAIDQIDESEEGVYITTIGTVTQSSGSQFTIADNVGNKVKVVVRKPDLVQKPRLQKGDQVEVSGIVSEYKNEYRILPFEQEGVRIITSGSLPKAGPSESISLICGSVIYLLCKPLLKTKKKHFG